jgi:hypothetical protein
MTVSWRRSAERGQGRDGRKAITEVYLVLPTDTQAAEEKRAQKCADFLRADADGETGIEP